MKILKIVAYALLSITGVIGGVAGYAYVTGMFEDKVINISSLQFTRNDAIVSQDFVVIDDFTVGINYTPDTATNLDVDLEFVNDIGNNVVSIPSKVKANTPFNVQILQDENGNNRGGEVVIRATSGFFSTTRSLRFWVDVKIPTNGLMMATNVPNGELIAGGNEVNGYVFTDPALAIYPEHGSQRNFTLYDYKTIQVAVESAYAGNMQVITLPQSQAEGHGYFNPNYLTNGESPVIEGVLNPNIHNPNIYSVPIRFYKFRFRPLNSSPTPITIQAKSLRTYAMQDDFVDISDRVKYPNEQDAYTAFSAYVQKYSNYIIEDDYEAEDENSKKFYYEGELIYNNGQEFLDSVTQVINGQPLVVISLNTPTTERDYAAALFYLYVNHKLEFMVNDIQIEDIKSIVQLPTPYSLHSDLLYGLTSSQGVLNLINTFELELETSGSVAYSNEALKSKFSKIIITAHKNQFDAGGNIVRDIEGNPVVIAADEFIITNPGVGATNPVWRIIVKDPQTDPNNGLRLRFSLYEGITHYYTEVLVNIDSGTIETLTINDSMFKNLTVNSGDKLSTSWTSVVNNYPITEASYNLQHTNSAYTKVKWFVTADSSMNNGFFKVRLHDSYSSPWINTQMTLNFVGSGDTLNAYEITYKGGSNNIILQALNVSGDYDLKIFAAIVQTDYLGNEVVDTDGNYYIVQKSEEKQINITSYIENLNFYTAIHDSDTNSYSNFVKRNVAQVGGTEDFVTLFSNKEYKFIVTNLELGNDGMFDLTHPKYNTIVGYFDAGQTNPIYESTFVNYQANLTYALRKDAYGSPTERNDYVRFAEYLVYPNGSEGQGLGNILNIQQGINDPVENLVGTNTYTYDTANDFIIVSVNVSTRERLLATTTGNVLPEFVFDLYGVYIEQYRPINLANSVVNIRVRFASLENEILLLNELGEQISSSIELRASANQGQVEWKIFDYISGQLTNPLVISELVYYFDIAQTDAEGIYINPKLDYFQANSAFVESYLTLIRNTQTRITWTSSNTEFLTINMVNGLPVINVVKGTVGGTQVLLHLDISTYPDASGNYLQTKRKTIAITLVQDAPVYHFYSNLFIDEGGAELKEIAIVNNSGISSQKIDGGNHIDILSAVGNTGGQGGTQGLQVYEYQTGNYVAKTPAAYTAKLLDVTVGENASIIGDIVFEIQDAENSPIYFKNIDGNKVYTAQAVIDENNNNEYKLLVFANNVTIDITATLLIHTPFGDIRPYFVTVVSNIEIIQSFNEGQNNLTIKDNESIELSNHYRAEIFDIYEQVLYLPITFEYDDVTDVSATFSNILQGTNSYSVGHTALNGIVTHSSIYYYDITNLTGAIQVTNLYTTLSAVSVANNKFIGIKLYYYVPMIDNEGDYIYLTTTGVRLFKSTNDPDIYVTREIDVNGEFVLDIDGNFIETVYNGNKLFLFEKMSYDPVVSLPKVIITPSVEIASGNLQWDSGNILNPVNQGLSGQDFSLTIVKVNDVVSPTNSTLVNIKLVGDTYLFIPDIINIPNSTYDYTTIYSQHIVFEVYALDTNDVDYMAAYSALNPRINNGYIVTNPVNFDLNIGLRASLIEGRAGNRNKSTTNITFEVLFKNSVRFLVNTDKVVEGDGVYDAQTGHTYTDVNKVNTLTNTITVKQNNITLYSNVNTDLNDNFVNLVGGNNIDLMNNINDIRLYWYNEDSVAENKWELYQNITPAVSVEWTTNQVTLKLLRAVNEPINFKLVFYADVYNIGGSGAEYFFRVVPSVTVSINYPMENDFELVSPLSAINLHANYVNPYNRIQINYNGQVYTLKTNGTTGLIYLENINNISDIITVRNHEVDPSSVGINYFSYRLLDSNKNNLTNTPEITGTFPYNSVTNTNGTINFTNNFSVDIKEYYIRVITFNGAYVDYKFRLSNSITQEDILIRKDGSNITSLNRLQVFANTDINLFSYITITNGLLSNVLLKYDNYDMLAATIGGTNVDHETVIVNGNLIRFINIASPQMVTLSLYTKNFTNNKAPLVFYLEVLPNFVAANNVLAYNVPAGAKVQVVNTNNGVLTLVGNSLGIMNISGDTSTGVSYEITSHGIGNSYGIQLITEADIVYIISNDLSAAQVVTILVTKDFGSGIVYTTTVTFTLRPDAVFNEVYNNTTFQQLTAAAVEDGYKVFNLQSNINIRDLYNNAITNQAGIVTISYSLSNATGTQAVAFPSEYLHSFNTNTGLVEYKTVNETKNLYIKMQITWLRNQATTTDYSTPVEYFKVYNIRIVPNITSVNITYTDSNQSLTVYAGTTVELMFTNPANMFAEYGAHNIKISTVQQKVSGTQDVNLVIKAINNSFYTIRYDGIRHIITFKHVSANPYTVNIPLYLNLIDNITQGVVTDSVVYYATNMYINFTIVPSITNIALKPEFSSISNENTALVVDYEEERYTQNVDGTLTLLNPNQYDLVELYNLTLVSGLNFSIVNKALVRNALVYVVERKSGQNYTEDYNNAIITNGIVSFMPSNSIIELRIRVSLFTVGNQQNTIYISLSAGGLLEVNSISYEPNSGTNEYELDLNDTENTFDLRANIIYGLEVNNEYLNTAYEYSYVGVGNGEYLYIGGNLLEPYYHFVGTGGDYNLVEGDYVYDEGNGEYDQLIKDNMGYVYVGPDNGEYDQIGHSYTNQEVVSGDGKYTFIYRETTYNGTQYIKKTTVLNLSKNGVSFTIAQGNQYVYITNNILYVRNIYTELDGQGMQQIQINVLMHNLHKVIYVKVIPLLVEWKDKTTGLVEPYIGTANAQGQHLVNVQLNNVVLTDSPVYSYSITTQGYSSWGLLQDGNYYIVPNLMQITENTTIEVEVQVLVNVNNIIYTFTRVLSYEFIPVVTFSVNNSSFVPDFENDLEVLIFEDNNDFVVLTNAFGLVGATAQKLTIKTLNANVVNNLAFKLSNDTVIEFTLVGLYYQIELDNLNDYTLGSFIIKDGYFTSNITFNFIVELTLTIDTLSPTYTKNLTITIQQNVAIIGAVNSYTVDYLGNGTYEVNRAAAYDPISFVGNDITLELTVKNVSAQGVHGNIDANITATYNDITGIISITITQAGTYNYSRLEIDIELLNDGDVVLTNTIEVILI